MHQTDVVVDVRSRPYAKFATHFHGPAIQQDLVRAGLKYLYFGKEMGGMPDDPLYMDADGHADYEKIASSESFQRGVQRLQTGLQKYRIALMCGEEDPTGCHRRNLIAAQLALAGINCQHIRRTGEIQTQEYLASLEPENVDQLRLF